MESPNDIPDFTQKMTTLKTANHRLSVSNSVSALLSKWMKRFLGNLCLIAVGLLIIFPFYWTINLSFQTIEQISSWSPYWFPVTPTLMWYQAVFEKANLGQPLLNTLIVSLSSTVCVLFLNTTAAYPLARLRFPLRGLVFTIIISTMMIPETVLMIPRYLMTSWLGLLNTYAGLFVPYLGWPFGVFLLAQFMRGIPKELEESAKIDGASYPNILWSIIVPLCKGPLITLAIMEFLGNWNFFQWPLIVISNDTMRTLAIAVFFLQGRTRGAQDIGMVLVGAIICILPVLAIYLIFQRHIVGSLGSLQMKG
jgi:ABC-type glycerol-3-phosphate transport system permease component